MSGGEAIPGLGSGRIPKGTTRRSSDHLGARAELSPAGFRMSPKGTTSKAKLSPAGLQNGAARNCGAVTNFSEWRRSDSWCIFRMEPPGTAERSEAIPGLGSGRIPKGTTGRSSDHLAGSVRYFLFENRENVLSLHSQRLRSTMDSIWVSGTQDLGSIPSGATK